MKARIKQTMAIYGYGAVIKGQEYEVIKYNGKFVYVKLNGKTLRLNKDEVELKGKMCFERI